MTGAPKLDRRYEWARLAAALSADSRNHEVRSSDVLRVLRHQLRTLNTNKAVTTPPDLWSVRAKEVFDDHTARDERVPPNGFDESLHCDHIYALRVGDLNRYESIDDWLGEIPRFTAVVVVTARENYRLARAERKEWDGPLKYKPANVRLVSLAAVRGLFPAHPGDRGKPLTMYDLAGRTRQIQVRAAPVPVMRGFCANRSHSDGSD
jgi:hypothetical protein